MVTVNENAMRSAHVCVNLNEVEQTIETVIENMEKIKLDREENLLKLLMQKNTIEKELHNTSNDGSPSVCALRDIYILQKNKSKIKLQKVLINVLQQLNAQSGEKIL
jgi:hypothetical protein